MSEFAVAPQGELLIHMYKCGTIETLAAMRTTA